MLNYCYLTTRLFHTATRCPYHVSGKSTLINAFLGNEILPVNNVPETARICRISHVPSSSCPEPVLELNHAASVASRLNSLVSPGSSPLDATILSSSPSISSTDAGSSCKQSNSDGEACEVLVGAAAIREHLQQLNRDVRAREHLRNDEKVWSGVNGVARGLL